MEGNKLKKSVGEMKRKKGQIKGGRLGEGKNGKEERRRRRMGRKGREIRGKKEVNMNGRRGKWKEK